jgi:hypothetical protein
MTLAQLHINVGKSILPPVPEPYQVIVQADYPYYNQYDYSNNNKKGHDCMF